jgi:hypothetical protein
MMEGQLTENLLSLRRKRNEHFATVIMATGAVDETSSLQPVYQFHCAVVANLHPIGELADARPDIARHSLDRKQQLVLPPFQARRLYHLLAEVEKAPDLVAELRQRLVVRQSEFLHVADSIVSRFTANRIVS